MRESGDYLVYALDWEKNEMQLVDAGGVCADLDRSPIPVTPFIYSLKRLAQASEHKECRFVIDAKCSGQTATFNLHRTEDFNSVVNVARPLVAQLLRGTLTRREVEVAVEFFEGRTIRYIAGLMHITEGTVKRNIHNIYQKMHVASQVELIREIYVLLAQHAAQIELQG